MGNKGQYGFQRLDGCPWIARYIDNQAAAKGPGNGTAQGGEGGVAQSFTSHLFAKSFQDALTDLSCGLWRDIAGGNARTSCCDNQSGLPCLCTDRGRNLDHVIGNNLVPVNDETRLLQAMDNLRSGAVGPKAAKTGVADSDNSGIHISDSTLVETELGRA